MIVIIYLFTTLNDYENEDEIKRYLKDKDGGGHDTIIAVLEGDYVRFAKELKNRNLTKE